VKVSVITRHAISNYGSLLQTIATQHVIERMGHTCEIIDYIRDDESYIRHELTLLKRKPEWYNNPIKRVLYMILRQPESVLAGRKFEKERLQYLNLSRRYSEYQQLEADAPAADIYVTGSDQVWGPVENGTYDKTYCLAFIQEKKKISYAASFGRTEMSNELKEYYYHHLSKYDYLTVREDSAVSILKSMGLTGIQVLDPTLLLDGYFWSKLCKPIKEKNYILVYQLGNNKTLNNYAKKLARVKNLQLIRVSPTLHQAFRGGKFAFLPSLEKFLSLVKNANCLITDSFHGTAFAINFGTQFIEILPTNTTSSRNVSILRLTGLTDRILSDPRDLSLIDKKIDFKKVELIIRNERKRSLKILGDMLHL